MNVCEECGTEFEGAFCPICGKPADGKRRCVHCGAELPDGARFCNSCGKSQEETAKPKNGGGVKAFFSKIGNWIKTHKKIFIASVSVVVALIIVLSVTIPIATNKFRAGKVAKIHLGDSRARVEKVLGSPDSDERGTLEYYGKNYKKIFKKLEKIEKEIEESYDFDKVGSLMEQQEKLEEEADKLVYKYISVDLDSEDKVVKVFLDKKHTTIHPEKKEVKKIVADKLPYGVDIKSCSVKVEIYYKDGSYSQYNLSLGSCKISGTSSVEWSDEYGEYSMFVERSNAVKKGDTINGVTEGGTQYSLTALESGTSADLPNYKLTLSGSGAIDLKGFEDKMKAKITEIVIEEGITGIGDKILNEPGSYNNTYKFANLSRLSIPDSISYIGNNALNGLENLSYNEYDNALYLGNANNPYVALIKAKSEDITSCKINDDVKYICVNAFNDCKSLKYNELDDGYYLGSEETPKILLNKVKLSDDATTYNIADSVRVIRSSAFSGCDNLQTIIVGEDNKNYVFQGGILYNKAKTDIIYVPKAISGDIKIANGVTSIGKEAFRGCKISSIEIPSSVTSIGESAFRDCSIVRVMIPSSVTSIEKNAFWTGTGTVIYCESENAKGWNYNWYGEYNHHMYPIVWDCKNNDKDKDGYAHCVINGLGYQLKDGTATVMWQPKNISGNIVIPSSVVYKGETYNVTSIEHRAFWDCSSLTSIEIPSSVTSIGEFAFWECSSLTIYCEAESEPWGWHSHWNFANQCPVVWDYKNK